MLRSPTVQPNSSRVCNSSNAHSLTWALLCRAVLICCHCVAIIHLSPLVHAAFASQRGVLGDLNLCSGLGCFSAVGASLVHQLELAVDDCKCVQRGHKANREIAFWLTISEQSGGSRMLTLHLTRLCVHVKRASTGSTCCVLVTPELHVTTSMSSLMTSDSQEGLPSGMQQTPQSVPLHGVLLAVG